MCDIKATDIIHWQNAMMELETDKNTNISQDYLKTLHNQLSAIFNYAVRFYDLKRIQLDKLEIWEEEEKKEMQFLDKKKNI